MKHISAINLFNYLLIFHLFGGAFVLKNISFEFYLGYVFIITFLFFCFTCYRKVLINKKFIIVLILLSFFGIANVFLGNVSCYALFKQIIGIFLTGLAYYLLVKLNDCNLNKLLKIYLKFALIVAGIGVIQQVSYLAHFKPGYNFTYFLTKFQVAGGHWGWIRVNSILPEPAHFGAAMTPAIFISLVEIFRNDHKYIKRWQSVLILIVSLMSFSLVAYVAIVVSIIIIVLNSKNAKLRIGLLILLPIFIFSSYAYIPEINARVNATKKVVTGEIPLQGSNLSVFAIITNASIAYRSFLSNPLFGSGLGSHPLTYDKYIASLVDINQPVYLLCKGDAGSMFLRLVSETGLIGLIFVFYFIFKFYVSCKKDEDVWIISNACFCLFLVTLMRMGHYFYNGFLFFVWAYYFSYKISQRRGHEKKYNLAD